MKTYAATIVLSLFACSLTWAAPKVKWPKDAVEWEKLEEAKKTALEEKKSLAFIFVPNEWDNKDAGVVKSIESTNDAIGDVKSYCVIVKGNMQAVARPAEDTDLPKALIEGFGKAGNTYPLIVIISGDTTTLLGATAGQAISEGTGKDIFRDAKKKHRALLKEKK